MTRQEAKDAILLLITDPTNKQNTAERVRDALSIIIDSAYNAEDDGVILKGEETLTMEEISPAPYAPPFYQAIPSGAASKSFYLLLNQPDGVVLYAPNNLVDGEIYTYFIEQAADTAIVQLASRSFLNQNGFNMVTGDGNVSMFQAYAHGGKLYCFPQQDFS